LGAALFGCASGAGAPCVASVHSTPQTEPRAAAAAEARPIAPSATEAHPQNNKGTPEIVSDKLRTGWQQTLELLNDGRQIRFKGEIIYAAPIDEHGPDCDGYTLTLSRMLGAAGPFEQVLVFEWHHDGNACGVWGLTFMGIRQDNTFVVDDISYCRSQMPTFKATQRDLTIAASGEATRDGWGQLPRKVWSFSDDKLRQIVGPGAAKPAALTPR